MKQGNPGRQQRMNLRKMNETSPKEVNSATLRVMSDAFPIQIPERLPIGIAPCPIVEAYFEARFVSPQPWATMPGLLFAQIRERYPEQKTLPVAQLPEEVRRQDATLLVLPLIQFLSDNFLVQLGPPRRAGRMGARRIAASQTWPEGLGTGLSVPKVLRVGLG